jgi:hypothetical protein
MTGVSKELVKPALPISLSAKQKMNIEVLSYHQAIKEETYTAEVIYKLWPTTGELERYAGPRPSITAIQQYQMKPEFRNSMAKRGIETDSSVGELTDEQLTCIALLTNMMDRRSPKAKLKALGIPYAKYAGWLKQKPFNDAMRSIASKGLEEAIPLAEVALARAAAEGDLPATKFFFEVTGRYNPMQQQAIDSQALVAVMIDAAQKVMGHDPELLKAYIDTVKLEASKVKGIIL